MNNIVIIKQGTGRYLFSLPDNVTLKEGDRVKCSTKRGITDGIAFADSAWVDENVSQLIGKLTGAKFPLKSVAGKMAYQPFEKPEDKLTKKYAGMSNNQLKIEMCCRGMCSARNDGRRKHDCLFVDSNDCDVTDSDRAEAIKYLLAEDAEAAPKPEDKPAEDKQEPVKLYCVKDYGSTLTGGKTYDFVDGLVKYDGGQKSSWHMNAKEFCEAVNENTGVDSIFPLVSRPANVGEWVYIVKTKAPASGYKACDVFKVESVFRGNSADCIESPHWVAPEEYLVLDGYHPAPEAEAEPEPEYFSGKVVCVDNGGNRFFEVGKVYCFYDGVIFGANGFYSSRYETLEKANCGIGSKFIEFKGGAHD